MIVAVLLTLFAITTAEPAIASPPANRWAEPTRGLLAQHCGQCHLPNLPTSVPRALAVFNLTEEPWYGRLTNDQFASLLERAHAIKNLTAEDNEIVESFVRCARDGDCGAADR